MTRSKGGRRGVDYHIHTGVDRLLVCVKTDEAALRRNVDLVGKPFSGTLTDVGSPSEVFQAALETISERVIQSARSRLVAMHGVIQVLMGQIVHWVSTGKVAANKIIHVGIPQARAIVRNKAGKKTEFGLGYLISRLGGGYVFGERIEANADERQMPLKALAGYRKIFGQEATPELVVYDRGGDSTPTCQKLALEGVKYVGIQPKGNRPWWVAEEVRDQVRSERGQTEGVIGSLKSNRYKFNKPKERLWQTLEMAGPRSILSFNLNKFMRDLVELTK